jgi:hypothetical protein
MFQSLYYSQRICFSPCVVIYKPFVHFFAHLDVHVDSWQMYPRCTTYYLNLPSHVSGFIYIVIYKPVVQFFAESWQMYPRCTGEVGKYAWSIDLVTASIVNVHIVMGRFECFVTITPCHRVYPCWSTVHLRRVLCIVSGNVKSKNVLQRFENVFLNKAKVLPFRLIKKKWVTG